MIYYTPTRFLFVGEKRSKKAITMGVTWKDGRLSACTLFKALAACGLNPINQMFANLWYDSDHLGMDPNVVRWVKSSSIPIVALGQKVSRALREMGVPHRVMTHPAARGKIRLTRNYFRHVRSVLCRKYSTT